MSDKRQFEKFDFGLVIKRC